MVNESCASSWSLRNASSTSVLAEGANWKLYGKICRFARFSHTSGLRLYVARIRRPQCSCWQDKGCHQGTVAFHSESVWKSAGHMHCLTFTQLAMMHDVRSHAWLSMQASISEVDSRLQHGRNGVHHACSSK